MAANRFALRKLWFQIHKWIGIALFMPVIIVSISGSALVWDEWLSGTLYPSRHHAESEVALPPSAYAAAGREALGAGERILSLEFGEGEPVLLTAAQPPRPEGGRPVRTRIWLDPADARVIDMAASNEGALRFLHILHGTLFVPEVGRKLVGWLGVAMLLSSLTGLWLWWPTKRRWFRGLRWKRGNGLSTNLHHQTGFWACIPLAMLSLTGAWISFPAFFGPLVGDAPPDRAARIARMSVQPMAETRLGPDGALASAQAMAPGHGVEIAWPTDRSAEWKVVLAEDEGSSEYLVGDATGEAVAAPPEEPRRASVARTMRVFHDGNGMGLVWQIIIFVGGLVPAILGITGIVMWLRSRGWRRAVADRTREAAKA
ncbi:PepSY-associated TM helix domain-containing protein [Parasphingopyxis marina]|uniref:PepSY domain-containing protein n=1 Tax=Parasphingopyxis marina TaxID=2761622 RepID=A0A842HYZ1_9SPHN|nr:PepSY-associated TM helix domain-containing protein [Parasphingopyxis marina]MBC2776714.1 PepSY domain-containing protein [Parasphingopyxis marina]